MTDRNIIKAYNTYIAALRKNIPLEEEERCTYFSDCKDMIYRNLDEDEASVVYQAVSCNAEDLVRFFLLSYGETLESCLTNK